MFLAVEPQVSRVYVQLQADGLLVVLLLGLRQAMANVSEPALRQWAEDLKDDHNECAAQPSLKLAAMSADPPLSNRSLLRG